MEGWSYFELKQYIHKDFEEFTLIDGLQPFLKFKLSFNITMNMEVGIKLNIRLNPPISSKTRVKKTEATEKVRFFEINRIVRKNESLESFLGLVSY